MGEESAKHFNFGITGLLLGRFAQLTNVCYNGSTIQQQFHPTGF